MARAALVLLSMTAVTALHVTRCMPPLSLAQRRSSNIVAKTKRSAPRKPAKRPKAEDGFDLQSAMVNAQQPCSLL